MRLFLFSLIFIQSVFSDTVRLEQVDKLKNFVVDAADYKLNISGPFTEINATITVYNKSNHEDKVTFFYKLPDDATVTGFALDINGKMRQASTVEKDKARIAFESEVRRKIDPALMEWNQGNIFQTQIYPVEGNGRRKITVSYIVPTKKVFTIPLEFQHLQKLNFSVSSKQAFTLEAPINMLKLSNSEGTYVELRTEKVKLKGNFKLSVKKDSQKLYTEKNKDQNLYWVYKEKLSFPKKQHSLDHVKSIAVFQDSSLSRDNANLVKETEFLQEVLQSIKKPVTIKLYRFNVSSEFYKKYTIDSDESFKTFASDYQNCIADGGTDFSKLIPSVKLSKADLKFIFSDGLNNYENFSTDEKVFTVNSSGESDIFTLKAFGHKSINLNQASVADALNSFLNKDFLVTSKTPDTFGKIKDNQLIATGILKPGEKAEFSIYQDGTEVKKVRINTDNINTSDVVRKYWSQQKLYSLLKNSVKNKREITELGKSHNLVTPYTSMIVLETLRQYLRHEIRPSEDEPELQALYDERYKPRKVNTDNQLARITKDWLEYKAWWEKYSSKKKAGPAIVKVDRNTTEIDQIIAQRRAEQANEEEPAVYDREFFESTENSTPDEQVAEAQTPAEVQTPIVTTPKIDEPAKDELIEKLNISKVKKSQIKAKLNNLNDVIEQLNNENDGLKNENGRIRAENMRISRILEELKELYVADRNVMSVGGGKAEGDAIAFSKWEKNSPTFKALQSSKAPYKEYLKRRSKNRTSPGFFFECAEYFLSTGNLEKAYIILSNIIEISNKNSTLLRMAAYKMAKTELLEEAIYILREIITLRPEEPHSYRDLALALIEKAEKTENTLEKDSIYTEALSLYKKIIESSWYRTNEFRGLSTVLIEEYNNLVLKSKKTFQLTPKLKDNLDMDLRVVISWDSDMTDVDLHIVQPDKEKVYYGNRVSNAGGRMSNDYTRGLGPEIFGMRYALPGEYKIYGKVYSADALFFNGQISVKVDIYLNYGRPNQVHKSTTVKITEKRKEIELAKIKLE